MKTWHPKPRKPQPAQLHLRIVAGPPGSGKTTYVNQHKGPEDLVWDYDAILRALGLAGSPLDMIPHLCEMRKALLESMRVNRSARIIWVITTNRAEAQTAYAIMGTSQGECIRRLVARDGSVSEDMIQAVKEWFQ